MEINGRNKLLIARIGLAVNMLNKKSAVAAKGWPSNLQFGF
jgi:hypothetical protein